MKLRLARKNPPTTPTSKQIAPTKIVTAVTLTISFLLRVISSPFSLITLVEAAHEERKETR